MPTLQALPCIFLAKLNNHLRQRTALYSHHHPHHTHPARKPEQRIQHSSAVSIICQWTSTSQVQCRKQDQPNNLLVPFRPMAYQVFSLSRTTKPGFDNTRNCQTTQAMPVPPLLPSVPCFPRTENEVKNLNFYSVYCTNHCIQS